jgi:hypothetical protein
MRMKASQAEKGRVSLVNWMFTSFYGLAFAEWVRLLWKHRFDVDPPYGPRAALMTLTSTLTSLLRASETQKDGPRLVDVHVRHPRSSWDIGGTVRPSYIISSSPPTNNNSRTLICGRPSTRTLSSRPSDTPRSPNWCPRRRASSTIWTSVPLADDRRASQNLENCRDRAPRSRVGIRRFSYSSRVATYCGLYSTVKGSAPQTNA